ncbi:hypothetical protein JCM3774_000849 [Rhodotorula dairenensis]
MALAGPLSNVRALVARLAGPARVPLPFFRPSTAAPLPANPASPAALFVPSYRPTTLLPPSSHFLLLRRSFHSHAGLRRVEATPSPWAGLARRAFHGSSGLRAYRPYYGRGSSGGFHRRPEPTWRDRFDSIPAMWIVGTLIALNLAVFAAWNYGYQLAQRFRDASWIRFLQRNFTTSWTNFTQGRVWTLATSAFSHEGTSHILVNMASLFFMAPAVISVLGNSGFLALYFFAGITSSTVSLLFNHFVNRQNPNYAAHGASGATYGAISFFAAAFPRETFLLFFVVPVPAWLCVSGIFAWDLYNGLFRRGGMTDSAGHVGGMLAGVLFFLRKVGRV